MESLIHHAQVDQVDLLKLAGSPLFLDPAGCTECRVHESEGEGKGKDVYLSQ
jgi:hypothetical protein